MEPQKTPNSQGNLKKEEQSWRRQTSWFQTSLQSYSIKTACYPDKKDTQTNGTELSALK